MNYKVMDKEAIVAYLKGKECVKVEDILAESGAERLRIYPLLFELELEGKLVVLDREVLGSPVSVKLS